MFILLVCRFVSFCKKLHFEHKAKSLEVLGEDGAGGLDLDYSFAGSKVLTCWENGQPLHTRPALAAPDKLSVLLKRVQTGEDSDSISLKG